MAKNALTDVARRLNVHLASIVSTSRSGLIMPVEMRARTRPGGSLGAVSNCACPGRLSSFGFSGTIAHGAFAAVILKICGSSSGKSEASLYRAKSVRGMKPYLRMALVSDQQGLRNLGAPAGEFACAGMFPPTVEATMADHVVGSSILLPGVGYAEMALALSCAA